MNRAPRKPNPNAGKAWCPVPYEAADITAMQAIATGDADRDQQQRAMKWIIEDAAQTYGLSYRPESERDTAFAEGRRFVGLSVVKLLKLNASAFVEKDT